MLGAVTLRDLAARIQEVQPEALDWWNALTTDERKEQLAKVVAAEKAAKTKESKKSGTKKRPAQRSRGGGPDAPTMKVPPPRPPGAALGLLTGKLETRSLMKQQPGSNGSEGMKYLRDHSPFADEQRAQTPRKPAPKKAAAKKPAARRAAPGVHEAARNTNKKLAAAGFAPMYDFGS